MNEGNQQQSDSKSKKELMPEMCIKCDKGFACKADLKTHVVKVYQKEQKYKKHKYNVKLEIKEWHCSKCN